MFGASLRPGKNIWRRFLRKIYMVCPYKLVTCKQNASKKVQNLPNKSLHHNEDWNKILSKLLIQDMAIKQDSKKSLSVNKCTSAYSLCLINVRLCLYEAVRN